MFKEPIYFNIKDEIEKKLSALDIYQYYINKKIDKIPFKCKSPFRNENNPSFNIFYNSKNRLIWKDFTLNQTGDVYKFVMILFNLNFNQALILIKNNILYHSTNNSMSRYVVDKHITQKQNSNIIITPYYFKDTNIPKSYYDYWTRFKVITKSILLNNNVSCAKYIYLNNSLVYNYKNNDIIIVYKWKRKNIEKIYYKIYKPMSKDYKWLSNFRGSSKYLVHGLNTIDNSLNYVIITKSVKDKMVLEGLGFNTISIQNEGISIPEEIINYLRNIYTYIYLLYDNDYDKSKNWGQIAAKKIINIYKDLINIKIKGTYKCTDISEFIEKYNIDKSKQIIKQQLINEK